MRGRHVFEPALNLLFPRRCPVCHGIAPRDRRICPECIKKLPYIETKRCRICGKPVTKDEALCTDCKTVPHVYREGIGIFRYEEIMRGSISYFKYKGRREYGEVLGELAARSACERIRMWDPQAVVPVPIHRKRLIERGYNQAAVLSAAVSKVTGIPHEENALIRREKTLAMKNLNAAQRAENMRGVFAVREGYRPPERILIVDDIYTTGATIDAAASALKAAGAGDIFFLSVCIGSGYMVEY